MQDDERHIAQGCLVLVAVMALDTAVAVGIGAAAGAAAGACAWLTGVAAFAVAWGCLLGRGDGR